MNELEIKRVPFMGTELMAARDTDGQIWAGVRWMCDGLGLSEGQRKRQIANIQADKVLSKGGSNLVLPTRGGNQEVLCLKLDFVPLWLAKISITPTMEAETPELAANLEQYQLRAKDVLAAAFLPKKSGDRGDTPKLPALSSVNGAMKMALQAMDEAGVDPAYKLLALRDAYAPYGLNIHTGGLEMPEKLYDLTGIAEVLGVLSARSGKPHAKAIGAILGHIGVMPHEVKIVPFTNNGHSGTCEQYTEPVLSRARDWLDARGWPMVIEGPDGTNYKVRYE